MVLVASGVSLLGVTIKPYEPLATRLDPKAVQRLIEPEPEADAPALASAPPATAPAATAPSAQTAASDAATLAAAASVEGNSISIDEFLRVDLRIAKILKADVVSGADKLLKLPPGRGRTRRARDIRRHSCCLRFEGFGRPLIVVVANLERAKCASVSRPEMMLAAGPGGREIFLLSPDAAPCRHARQITWSIGSAPELAARNRRVAAANAVLRAAATRMQAVCRRDRRRRSAINQCSARRRATIEALAELLDRPVLELNPVNRRASPARGSLSSTSRACIGCARCLGAMPGRCHRRRPPRPQKKGF